MPIEILASDVPSFERIAHLHMRLAAATDRRAVRRREAAAIEPDEESNDSADAPLRIVQSK